MKGNKTPIDKSLVEEWRKLRNEAANLESKIHDRITDVLSIWAKAFGGEVMHWDFYGAEKGEIGNLSIVNDTVDNLCVQWKGVRFNDRHNMFILTKDNKRFEWCGSFPTRWLFEDCEDEIVNGKKLYDEKLKKKKADAKLKRSARAKINAELADQAKDKLTPEELEALKKIL